MKWIVWAAAAALVCRCGWLPFEAVDAGKLYVVEDLMIEWDDGEFFLRGGDVTGGGEDVETALKALEENAPGQLFLRQTRRLIFCGGAEKLVDPLELPWEIPAGATVYRTEKDADEISEIQNLGDVLNARERRREDTPTLAQVRNSALLNEEADMEVIE